MRAKVTLFHFVFFFLFLTASTAALAQEALTQTFTSADGQITMSYPEGWTVEEDEGLINFGDGAAFLQVNYHNYGDQVTLLEILEIGASVAYGFSEPESVVVGGWPGLKAVSSDQHHTLINFCDGNIALSIGFTQPGDMAAYRPTFEAMLDTIQYGDAEPQLCRGPFEGLQPITTANAASLASLTTLGDAAEPVQAVAFSPDGKLLAAGYENGTVQLWSVLTGDEQGTLTGHSGGATSLSFDTGTYQIVVGTGSGQVRFWEVATGDALSRLQEHDAAVTSVARQPDGFLIASGAEDGSVRVYDMLAGSERPPLAEAGGTPVSSIAFSPDGVVLAAGGGNVIRLWDAESGVLQEQVEMAAGGIDSLIFRPDGTELVFADENATVWAWDMAGNPPELAERLAPLR